MTSVRRFVEGRLGLKVNERKSMVNRPWNCTFLGFSFYRRKGTHVRVSRKALDRFKDRVREATSRSNGWSMEARIRALNTQLAGWTRTSPWPGPEACTKTSTGGSDAG